MPKKSSSRASKRSSTPKSTQALSPVLMALAVLIVLVISGVFVYKSNKYHTLVPSGTYTDKKVMMFDFGNQKLMVDDMELDFVQGAYLSADGEQSASISSRTTNTSMTRAAAILTDNAGGSGTFYYVVGAQIMGGKEVHSQPVLLGDRVMVESLKVSEDNIITVQYWDRAKNAPMTAKPTVKKTVRYSFQDNGALIVLTK